MVKNSSSQNGSTFAVIIVILAVAIVGALGFVFWQNYINKQQSTTTSESNVSGTVETDQAQNISNKFDVSIHEIDIKMQSAAEINLLPSYTPASFKSYMRQLLVENPGGEGMFDCGPAVLQYQISKISQVNIEGGIVPVNESGEICSGGAPAIWVLTPSGVWDQETRNGIVCMSKGDGLIYEEFASECYLGENTNSFIKNPNGSIKSLDR